MRCANCGNELKAGSLYCDVCGHPVQIVPDYNEFDDYLDNLVGNDDRRTDGQKTVKPVSDRTIRFDEPVREQLHSAGQWNGQKTDRMSQSVKQQVRQDQTGEQQSQTKQPCDEKPQSDGQRAKRAQQKKIIIISAVVCVVAIVILIAAITRNVSRSHDNSFDYQVKQAKAAYSAGNINSAVSYYEKALSIDSDNTDVRFALADIYMSKKDYDAALVLYQEIINIDPKSKEAYKKLISIYESKKDYDAIVALRESAKDASVLKLFADYTVSKPQFSKSSGKYGETIELSIDADSDTKIYYSYDSDDPLTRGERYYSPITLDKEGTYEITAVAVDDRGIKSEVASAKYEIEFEAPDAPEIDPDGGTFGAQTDITITVPENCKVYYTWDSSDPSAASTEYTAPIPVPEGNNVLSVIAIDQNTGMCSTTDRICAWMMRYHMSGCAYRIFTHRTMYISTRRAIRQQLLFQKRYLRRESLLWISI